MSNVIQACLYNPDPEASEELRQQIASLNFVRMIAETTTEEELANALNEASINLVFFHLDPDAAAVIPVIENVASRFSDIAMIAISSHTKPDEILAPIRAGCDQFVCKPIDPDDLGTAVSSVASKKLLNSSAGKCICVFGANGGVGTTSIACNLALEIAQLTKKRCALVDLDLQFGDLALLFDTDSEYTFFDLAATGGQFDEAVLESVMMELPQDVSVLTRPQQIEQSLQITPEVVSHAISILTSSHEHVVVDFPNRLDQVTFAAIEQADTFFIVCQLLVPSVRNAKRIFESIVEAGVPEERIEIIVNRGDSSGGRVTANDLEDTIKKPVFATIPSDYQYVARSLDFGKPIASSERNNAVRKAICRMARNIIGDAAISTDKQPQKGLLGRLLSKA